jgi:hypothetical protein
MGYSHFCVSHVANHSGSKVMSGNMKGFVMESVTFLVMCVTVVQEIMISEWTSKKDAYVEHPFLCDICNKSFSWQSCQAKHEIIHNVDHPFFCNVHKKSFSFHDNLKIHLCTHIGGVSIFMSYV